MKRLYISPSIIVTSYNCYPLLAGSPLTGGNEDGDHTQLSKDTSGNGDLWEYMPDSTEE